MRVGILVWEDFGEELLGVFGVGVDVVEEFFFFVVFYDLFVVYEDYLVGDFVCEVYFVGYVYYGYVFVG